LSLDLKNRPKSPAITFSDEGLPYYYFCKLKYLKAESAALEPSPAANTPAVIPVKIPNNIQIQIKQ